MHLSKYKSKALPTSPGWVFQVTTPPWEILDDFGWYSLKRERLGTNRLIQLRFACSVVGKKWQTYYSPNSGVKHGDEHHSRIRKKSPTKQTQVEQLLASVDLRRDDGKHVPLSKLRIQYTTILTQKETRQNGASTSSTRIWQTAKLVTET